MSEMAKPLNTKLVSDYPYVHKFIQVRENEEDEYVCLLTESLHTLSLLHKRYKKKKKHQENDKFPTRHYHINDNKYVQNEKSICLGVIGSLLVAQLQLNGMQ